MCLTVTVQDTVKEAEVKDVTVTVQDTVKEVEVKDVSEEKCDNVNNFKPDHGAREAAVTYCRARPHAVSWASLDVINNIETLSRIFSNLGSLLSASGPWYIVVAPQGSAQIRNGNILGLHAAERPSPQAPAALVGEVENTSVSPAPPPGMCPPEPRGRDRLVRRAGDTRGDRDARRGTG